MLTVYHIVVRRNEQQEVVGFFCPDFAFEHTFLDAPKDNLSKEASEVLLRLINTQYQHRSVPFPKSPRHYDGALTLGANDHWMQCEIEDKKFIKKWERLLPPFGVFSSIMTAITMAVLDFATTTTTVKSDGGIWLGSLGAIFSAIMAIIIYYFSNAEKISKIIGRRVDNIGSNTLPNLRTLSLRNLHFNVRNFIPNKSKLSRLTVTTIPIATTAFTSYSHYTQVMSIINNDLKDNDATLARTLKYIAFLMIIFSSYSKLVFQLSFMPSVYEKIDKLTSGKPTSFTCKLSFFSPRNLAHKRSQHSLRLTRLHASSHREDDVALTQHHSHQQQGRNPPKCIVM